MKQLTKEQGEIVGKLMNITLSGKQSNEEETNRLIGQLVELLGPQGRRELSHAIAIHRATLVLSKLQEMGYVAGP